jgi:UrcA family protein
VVGAKRRVVVAPGQTTGFIELKGSTMHMMSKIAAYALGMASLAALSDTASASIGRDMYTKEVRVEYRQAELRDEAGARKVFQRLKHAATEACQGGGALGYGRAFRECRRDALSRAVKAIDSPQLWAVAESPDNRIRLAQR